jgi:aminoglycoside phosphotransferase (APT) family kinase protein
LTLASQQNDLPPRETAQAVLDIVAPGSTLYEVLPLAGSYSNLTHLVEARAAGGSPLRIVVRRYVYGKRTKKARVEFNALRLLQAYDVPAPQLLYLDAGGAVLGRPGMAMRYVPGRLLDDPADHPAGPVTWTREMATMLARIHAIPGAQARDVLFDANSETTWFLRDDIVPDYMQAHPDGARVWRTVYDLLPRLQPVIPTLVHTDYWRGNVLWERGQISAVVDWEEAGCGDPGIDVGYCIVELVIMGMLDEAAEFLRVYETEMGHPVANLAFWQLAAAARPMYDIEGWITDSAKGERFRQFIAEAIARAAP